MSAGSSRRQGRWGPHRSTRPERKNRFSNVAGIDFWVLDDNPGSTIEELLQVALHNRYELGLGRTNQPQVRVRGLVQPPAGPYLHAWVPWPRLSQVRGSLFNLATASAVVLVRQQHSATGDSADKPGGADSELGPPATSHSGYDCEGQQLSGCLVLNSPRGVALAIPH